MERVKTTNAMYDIGKVFEVVLAFNSVNDRTELLNIILTKMMEITHSDAGTLYVVDGDKLRFNIVQNKKHGIYESTNINEESFPPIILDKYNIQNVSAYAAIKNEVVSVDDVYDDNEKFNLSGPKKYDRLTGYRTRAMLVIPMCTQGGHTNEVLGVIQMMNPTDPVTGEETIYFDIANPILQALTKIAANTLSNLTYVNDLRVLLHSFATVLTQAIDERSPYNNNHTQNVAFYCEWFAMYLSSIFPKGHKFHFDTFHIERLVLAALLHDIGKIITPLQIMDKSSRLGDRYDIIKFRFELKKCQIEIDWLHKRIADDAYAAEKERISDALAFVEYVNTTGFLDNEVLANVATLQDLRYKDIDGNDMPLLDEVDLKSLSIRVGTLTAEEREIMQEHVVITGRLLDKIPFLKYYDRIPAWARCHHEFLDGTGYPLGLSGDEIPVESCIITIMDIFDALIAKDRPYKKAMPVDKAIGILEKMAEDGKLHKELVQLFVESQLWEGIKR